MQKKTKKRVAIVAAVVAVVMIIGATFAWFSTTDKVRNEFGMENFDVAISEDFDPEVPVVPGGNITKNINVENGGNVDVVVRVKLEESLKMLEQDTTNGVDKVKLSWTKDSTGITGNKIPALVNPELYESKIDQYTKKIELKTPTLATEGVEIYQKSTKTGDNTVYSYFAVKKVNDQYQLLRVTPTAWEGGNKAEPTAFDVEYGYNTWKADPVENAIHGKEDNLLNTYFGGVFHDAVTLNFGKNVQTDGAALAQNTIWYLADDGYFYYCKPLVGGAISEPLLESVQFNNEMSNQLRGAEYTLTPVMEAVQKNHEAVPATWKDLGTYSEKSAVAAVNTDKEQLVYNVVAQNAAYHA